jgi:hypothetical protein
MSAADLSKALWDLANAITASALLQALAFAYACAKKEVADVINRRSLKMTIAIMLAFLGVGQSIAIEWCRRHLCSIDQANCSLYFEASLGRVIFISALMVFSILILYARQLFARRPFDG